MRLLGAGELEMVAGGEDVVVSASRWLASPALTYTSSAGSGVTGGHYTLPDGSPSSPGGGAAVGASVNVHVSSSHLADAVDAAKNVAEALVYIEEQLSHVDPDEVIVWAGGHMTASEILATINRTEFTVTDSDYSSGGGVGGSVYTTTGHNIDLLDYRAFDGNDQFAANGTKLNDYAAPGYTSNQGMNGIMLHEISHLTAEGNEFRAESIEVFEFNAAHSSGSPQGFVGSALWINNEKNANDMMYAEASALGIDLTGFSATYGTGASNPSIYRVTVDGRHIL